MYNFRTADREQPYLLPPSIADWLPENHLAWFVIDTVEQMNLAEFRGKYRADGHGGSAFEPSMMTALLLYAYCLGERSSRRIERFCETDIAFRVITANLKPDHTTIARFRRRHRKELTGLFVQILKLCRKAGLAKMGLVGLDGTKMKANAALDANRTASGIEKEVGHMFDEAEEQDREEDAEHGDRRGDELPEELRGRKSRRERLKECAERLKRESEEKKDEQRMKIAEREERERAEGRKLRGRKPADPESIPNPDAKANVTDPESRIMKTRKGYVQGYNAQAATNEEQIILAAEVTQEENDVGQLEPMMRSVRANAKAAGIREHVESLVADAGYWSDENARPDGREKTEYLIATTKDWKTRQAMKDLPPPRGPIPATATLREKMERKLRTKSGKERYRIRAQITEPVFGQIKSARGTDRFLLHGLFGADLEWKLICGTSNLLKLWRAMKAKAEQFRSIIQIDAVSRTFSADLLDQERSGYASP